MALRWFQQVNLEQGPGRAALTADLQAKLTNGAGFFPLTHSLLLWSRTPNITSTVFPLLKYAVSALSTFTVLCNHHLYVGPEPSTHLDSE